jgi:hypothetical protein
MNKKMPQANAELIFLLCIPPTIYLLLYLKITKQYKELIAGLSKFLIYSWGLEAILRFSVAASLILQFGEWYTYRSLYILEKFNLVLFMLYMFNLKTVQIYMDDDNDTEEAVEARLKGLKFWRFYFCAAIAIGFVFDGIESLTDYETRTCLYNHYALYNLVQEFFVLIAFRSASVYLLVMGWNFMKLFREYGHTKTYGGEVFMFFIFCITIPSNILDCIIEPLTRYKISIDCFNDCYECSDKKKHVIAIL